MHTLTLLLTLLASPARPLPDTTFWDGSWRRVQRPNAVYYSWTTPADSGRCRTSLAARPAKRRAHGRAVLRTRGI